MKSVLILFMVINISMVKAQSDTVNIIESTVSKIVEEARNGNTNYWHDNTNNIILSNPERAYQTLKSYQDDSSLLVRQAIVGKYLMLKNKIKQDSLKQEIVVDLLERYEQEKGFSGIPNDLISSVNKADHFNTKAQLIIRRLVQDTIYNKEVLMLPGIANMKNQLDKLTEFLPNGSRYSKKQSEEYFFGSREWFARLALARLGVQEQINYCIAAIADEDKSSYYKAQELVDFLVYIKKPEVLPILFDMLISNKEFEQKPLHSTSGVAIPALKKLLLNFPPEEGFSLTEEGVKVYKNWIDENKGKYIFK